MENTDRLRRHAEFCLNLSRFSSDRPMTEHLQSMAAEFHAKALKAEVEARFGPRESSIPVGLVSL
jgi:hypothetical protein